MNFPAQKKGRFPRGCAVRCLCRACITPTPIIPAWPHLLLPSTGFIDTVFVLLSEWAAMGRFSGDDISAERQLFPALRIECSVPSGSRLLALRLGSSAHPPLHAGAAQHVFTAPGTVPGAGVIAANKAEPLFSQSWHSELG